MKHYWFLLLVCASVFLLPISCSERHDPPTGRIVVVGMDALDLKIIQELISQKRLPTFQRLIEKGASGVLRSYHPMLSPMIWTTLATGRPPDEHGILDFTSLDTNGNPINVPSSKRKSPALWNIITPHGKSSTVIGWFATWPAETIEGVIVSDRFAPSLFTDKQNLFEDLLPNLTYPEKLAFSFADFRKTSSQIDYTELSPYLHINEEECRKILATPFSIHNRIHHLRLILARTETYANVLLDCLTNHASDITLAYFDGTDSVPHLFMQERPPRQPNINEEDFNRFSNAVDAMYERMDQLLKDILDRLNERDTLVVISDHGFRSGQERLKRSSLTTMGPAVSWHREEGTLIAFGPTIQPGEIQNASVFDITPSLFALLGIAPSPKMPGKILPELIGGKQKADSLIHVADIDAGYHPPIMPTVNSVNIGFDSEQLQALGYVAADAKQTESGKWENVNEYFNLGVYYERKGEYDKALQEIDRALSVDSTHRLSLGTRCRILIQIKQYEKAELEIARLEALLKEEIGEAETELAKDNKSDTSKTDLIQARVDTGRVGLSELYHLQGEMEFQRGNYAKATQSFSQSLERFSDNVETMYNLGTCYGITGQFEKSVEILTDLLQLAPNHQKGRQSLAVAYLRLKQGSLALPLLESLDRETPNDANINYLIGEAYRIEQNIEKAREQYNKALQIEPNLTKAKQKLEQIK